MNLKTTIVCNNPKKIEKEVKCYYDHDVQIVDKSCSETSHLDWQENNFLIDLIQQNDNQNLNKKQSECFILYKFELNKQKINRFLQKANEKGLQISFQQYNHQKSQILDIVSKQPTQNQSNNKKELKEIEFSEQKTYVLEIQISEKTKRVYCLPFVKKNSSEDQENTIVRSIHQSFKLFQILEQYISFDSNIDLTTFGLLSQQIFFEFSTFLYDKRIKIIQNFVFFDGHYLDWKILKKLGSIKLPEECFQNEECRDIKYKVFQQKIKEMEMHRSFNNTKNQFIQKVGQLQTFLGIKCEGYSDITIETLHHIKKANIQAKVHELIQHQKMSEGLAKRHDALNKKISQYEQQQKKQSLKNKQQIQTIKSQINCLRNEQDEGNRFVFKKKKSKEKQIKTKKVVPKIDKSKQNQKMQEKIDNSPLRRKSSVGLKKKTQIINKSQYQQKYIKFTKVMNNKYDESLEREKVRQKYHEQKLKVEFQEEKKLHEKKQRFQQATQKLSKMMKLSQRLLI